MPNTAISAEQAAKDIFNIIVKVTKESISDHPGQKEKLNPEQNKLAAKLMLGTTSGLFCGPTLHS